MYTTGQPLKRTVRIAYPAQETDTLVLRTELEWDTNLEPVSTSADRKTWTFEVEAASPFLYFKPCLLRDDQLHWASGANQLLLMAEEDTRVYYPAFFSSSRGKYSGLITFDSELLQREHKIRLFLPPGYSENTLSEYPVAYMHDGQNLFFPKEAFMGHEWEVDETSQLLRIMSAVEDYIIVGIYSGGNRMEDFTQPGYEKYARSIVEEVVPVIERYYRAVPNRRHRSVWGSSLGGVVSFFTAWQHPDVFGAAICMSSTFSHKDNLIERVLHEPPRNVAFYLDSGWPGDNYEVTMAMAMALVSRGWRYGHNLVHLSFPLAEHNELSWGFRLHLPMQFLNGTVAKASRSLHPVLDDIAGLLSR